MNILVKKISIAKIVFAFFSLLFVSCSADNRSKEYYESGEIRLEGQVVNGSKEGKWIQYDKSGNITTIFRYENGQIRLKETYINNNLTFSEQMDNGVKNGETISYFPNGKIKIKSNYVNGKKFGDSHKYYESGVLAGKQVITDSNNIVEFYQYYPNGKLFVYAKDFENGVFNIYDSLGNRTFDLLYKDKVLVDTLKTYTLPL